MTTSNERLDTVPDEILAAIPDDVKEGVRRELGDLTEWFGERWIGGPWDPKDDIHRHDRVHTNASLEDAVTRADGLKALRNRLHAWSAEPKPKRILLLLFLWLECWQLWDTYLVYRTLQVVQMTVGEVTTTDGNKPSANESEEKLEMAAWQAVDSAISLIMADTEIYRQIVLSNSAELAREARRGIETTKKTIGAIGAALHQRGLHAENWNLVARGLRYVEQVAQENQFFYQFIASAATALGYFHSWLTTASVPRTDRSAEQQAGSKDLAAAHRQSVLDSIDDALHLFHSSPRRLTGIILSRAEPWEQLLSEVREFLLQQGHEEVAQTVFVPRRVSIRYCYPFAVETPERVSSSDHYIWLDTQLRTLKSIKDDLNEQLKTRLSIAVRDVRPLEPTGFFAPRDSGIGLYSGIQVDLPDIELSTTKTREKPSRCKVWIVLSRMGNHCLCVEREALETPLPQTVYQAMADGTPFVFGVTTELVDDADGVATWDNLHSFGRDVIRAVANADFWRSEQNHATIGNDEYVRGNLHEVLIIRTDTPLSKNPDGIAARLNSALGGRILLRSIQRAPTTADEWIRYPPALQAPTGDAPKITGLPELGLVGDWCTHTGETTVFGIVAAPSWYSLIYAEAAQFASSWHPLLRLWSRRLQKAIDTASNSGRTESTAKELRHVEQTVRRHLAQIKSEELCSTLAYRRFLDQLLEMSGIPRLQAELESLLEAAERLMDWWSEDARRESEKQRRESEDARRESEAQRRKADGRRDKLLGVIALFGMFDLGGFLELANATHWHQSILGLFTVEEGIWEDWLLATLFTVALLIAILLGLFGDSSGLRRRLHRMLRLGPTRDTHR